MATVTPGLVKTSRQSMRLRKVSDVQARKVSVENELREAVAAARREGSSWSDVAKALGVTAQSAWKKFS